jgi:hypothetical protein
MNEDQMMNKKNRNWLSLGFVIITSVAVCAYMASVFHKIAVVVTSGQ